MIIDIFSNFDPIWLNLCYKNFLIFLMAPIIFLRIFWTKQRKLCLTIIPIISYISSQLTSTKLKLIKRAIFMVRITFILITYLNIIGILPYLFTITRHILFTISMGLPLWIFLIIRNIISSTKKFTAHFLPEEAPIWLRPFLTIIELIRTTLRPLTLSFRLAANITAGHVIIRLIFLSGASCKIKPLLLLTTLSRLYIIFELIICVIQAYIFCLLISLYANDHR